MSARFSVVLELVEVGDDSGGSLRALFQARHGDGLSLINVNVDRATAQAIASRLYSKFDVTFVPRGEARDHE